MKTYQCHKKVRAAKIVNLVRSFDMESNSDIYTLHFEGGDFLQTTWEWAQRHKPECGGYLVQYEDGYLSFSPAKAFESGYTELTESELTESELAESELAESE